MTKLIAVSARDNWDSLSRLERLLREKANDATGMESESSSSDGEVRRASITLTRNCLWKGGVIRLCFHHLFLNFRSEASLFVLHCVRYGAKGQPENCQYYCSASLQYIALSRRSDNTLNVLCYSMTNVSVLAIINQV